MRGEGWLHIVNAAAPRTPAPGVLAEHLTVCQAQGTWATTQRPCATPPLPVRQSATTSCWTFASLIVILLSFTAPVKLP